MTPFDFKDLEARLLSTGLPAAEAIAKVAAHNVLAWLKDSCAAKATTEPLFSIAAVVLAAVEPAIMAELDKIDGKVG